jgi:hypothetical protein
MRRTRPIIRTSASRALATGLLVCLSFQRPASAQDADAAISQELLANLPVTEITVFKDGHAFVQHQGTLPTDVAGNVRMDYLPTPVIGTFWPFSAEAQAKLTSVSAEKHPVEISRTALALRELLEANIGARVVIREDRESYPGTIAAIPARSAEELAATSAPGTAPQLPQAGQVLLLKTDEGTRVVAFDRIRDVTFVDVPNAKSISHEFRNVLTLHLDWAGAPHAANAQVGMTYLQRGIRWIPHYRITLRDDGQARVELQATLLNELADLNDVTAHLVIGVPSFDFKETIDPIALSETMAQLSQYFREQSAIASNFSNSIMIQTQSSRMGDYRAAQPEPPAAVDLGPEIANAGQNEELFLFTAGHITLKKGGRMVLPVGEWILPYEDVYKLSIPVAPPAEVRQQFNTQQQAELARLLHAPKVKHAVRLQNNQQVPLTTAPALFVAKDRLLGQGMMTYTSPGSSVDLTVTTAVNLPVKMEEQEAGRTSNAATFAGHQYDRIDVAGTISVTNYRKEPAKIEIERYTLGVADEAGQDGTITRLDAQQGGWSDLPAWWQSYSWPGWWHHLNSISRIRWGATIAPGEKLEVSYQWHYFWRW